MFTQFLAFRHSDATHRPVGEAEISTISACLRAVPGLDKALIYTPTTTHDPYLNDGPPPALVLQLYFSAITDLEMACVEHGPLHGLMIPGILPALTDAEVTEQVMLARAFPVSDTVAAPEPCCTYLVTYEGQAEDLNAWLSYYIAHHPPIMRRFPGIRAIEICTRVDWCSALPSRRVDSMQRNKVVFDTPDALTAALNSPVRHEMRADFKKFPPFTGGNTHYPMITRTVVA